MESIKEAVDFYCSDLPNPALVGEKFYRWKTKWINAKAKKDDIFSTLAASLKHCYRHNLLNIFILLKLFTMLPLSSCLSAYDLWRLTCIVIMKQKLL